MPTYYAAVREAIYCSAQPQPAPNRYAYPEERSR